jgi:hypothetical protein
MAAKIKTKSSTSVSGLLDLNNGGDIKIWIEDFPESVSLASLLRPYDDAEVKISIAYEKEINDPEDLSGSEVESDDTEYED